jgi:hypothetical protein
VKGELRDHVGKEKIVLYLWSNELAGTAMVYTGRKCYGGSSRL